jgi:hypothetical protein
MRGRKHPLEIFRENGGEFATRRSARPVGSSPERAPDAAPEAAEESSPRPEPRAERRSEPADPRKPRRTWDVRAAQAAGRTPAPRGASKPARRAGSTPLWRAVAIVAGLVLVVGAAYALKLWPAVLRGFSGQGTPLQKSSSFLENWRDPTLPPARGTEADSTHDGHGVADGSESGRADGPEDHAARPASAVETWLVVQSAKHAKDDKKWIELFRPDKKKLEAALGSEFPGMSVQLLESPKGDEGMLCVGPGATPDDPALERLKTKVRALGTGFDTATVRKFKKR